jgi:ACS family tartrate transporter-like MFS transporter
MRRLMPFLFLLYVVAYLDRINVSFAVLQMRDPLHLTDAVTGLGFAMFFAGYFFFQLPSNLVFERVGVRRWITALMITWGLVSCSMIFIRGPRTFYALRFLLGAAEAGFFPGMILYLRQWFPAGARARAVAWFMTANPVAGILGSPLSGFLLGLRGGGLAGWQWLFLLEGAPAILLGATVYRVLENSPGDAAWLPPEEREWLLASLARERGGTASSDGALLRALGDWRVWALAAVYFAPPACMYGVTAWLPTAVRSLAGLSDQQIGLVAAIPYVLTAVVMVLLGRHSDRTGERRWHTALPAFAGAAAFAVAANSRAPLVVLSGMSLGMMGAQVMVGPFWAMATSLMSAGTAAAAIAVINSVANLGGYYGSAIIGLLRSPNGSFSGGLLSVGAVLALGGVVAAVVGSPSVAGREPGEP